MNGQLKWAIKKCLTIINHPFICAMLRHNRSKDFVLGRRGKINNCKNLYIGERTEIGYEFRFLLIEKYHGGEYSPSCHIGKNCSIGNRFSLLTANEINIEDNCLIASDVLVAGENHGIDPEKTNSYATMPVTSAPVRIEQGCWIGEKVIILPGVTIGKRSIIGAGSVVTKSIPSYSIAVGNPAKVIKRYNHKKHCWEKIDSN